jgi:signal peptidase II
VSQTASSSRPQPDIRVGSATNALEPVSSAERSLAAGWSQWLALTAVAVAAVVADQVTKHTIAGTLALGHEWQVPGPFSIHHVRNTGIAFGLFSGATAAVVVVTGIAVLAMIVLFARSGQRHPLLPVGFGLVLGGSLSNLVDRVRLGYVTDFLDVSRWPAFNLADVFICAGVALLFISFVATDRSSARVGRLPLSRP